MEKDRVRAGIAVWTVVLSALAALSVPAAETTFPEGLSLEGQALAGLTLEEAREMAEGWAQVMAGQTVVLEVGDESVSTTAADLGFRWENEEAVREALSAYENSSLVKRYMLTVDYQEDPRDVRLETSVDDEALRAFVEENCKGLEATGQDATILRENGQFYVTPEVTGVEADIEATISALQGAIGAGLDEPVLAKAVTKEDPPRITAQALETIQDVLGTFSTDFSSSGAARSTNLSVGAGKINGHVLMPGETLSGYDCLQPFTVANGYQTAAAYENGQVVDSIGGGVCQIATTLYNAALLAELEITQRQNHSMSVGYVKPSQDAAIAGTYKDIKITNPYETPIYVEGYTEGRRLYFTIYGQENRPAGRQIRFESETLSVTDPGAPRAVLNPSLQPGTRKQVQSAHRGIKSRLWKVVLVDGVETERSILTTDTYNASPAVVQVGPPLPEQPALTQPGASPGGGQEPVQQAPGDGTTPTKPLLPGGEDRPHIPGGMLPDPQAPEDPQPLEPETADPQEQPKKPGSSAPQPLTPETQPPEPGGTTTLPQPWTEGTTPQTQSPEPGGTTSQTQPLVPESRTPQVQPQTWGDRSSGKTGAPSTPTLPEATDLPDPSGQSGRQLVPTVGEER